MIIDIAVGFFITFLFYGGASVADRLDKQKSSHHWLSVALFLLGLGMLIFPVYLFDTGSGWVGLAAMIGGVILALSIFPYDKNSPVGQREQRFGDWDDSGGE